MPAPAPARDTVAPALKSLSFAKAKVRRGGTLRLRSALSEGGALSVRFERLAAGRKAGKTCRAGARKGKKCTVAKPAGSATVAAGASVLNVKKLAVGGYRAVVTPVDAAGNRGASRTLSFKITRG